MPDTITLTVDATAGTVQTIARMAARCHTGRLTEITLAHVDADRVADALAAAGYEVTR